VAEPLPETLMNKDDREETQHPAKLGFFASFKAVAWSFVGLRRKQNYESDAAGLNPVHVVIAAVICVALFIAVLIGVVHLVLSK
jgi:hypothetical protein